MSENIIEHSNGTVIINGGDPLSGCPKDFDEANAWADQANENKDDEPKWEFDCGFKLDFDGPIVSVSSRFYPPKTHYGPTWDGNVTIYILGKEVEKRHFDCASLEQLREEVEKYVSEIQSKIKSLW